MKNFIDTVTTNLDEAIDSNLISIDMKESELTPRLYIKSNESVNTKFVVFGTDISSYSQGILCANKEIIKDFDYMLKRCNELKNEIYLMKQEV